MIVNKLFLNNNYTKNPNKSIAKARNVRFDSNYGNLTNEEGFKRIHSFPANICGIIPTDVENIVFCTDGAGNDYIYRVMPYIKNKKINKPFLIKGKFPTANNEVTILDGYAKKNNLKIGSKINLSDKEYTIVGYAYASDYMYPIINISSPMFDEQKHNIVFMHSDEYKNFNGV